MVIRGLLGACCAAALAACALAPAQEPIPTAEAVSQPLPSPEDDYREGLAALESSDDAVRAGAEAALRRAAERRHTEAQFALGLAHQTGRGARQDPTEAARWYRAAAESGHVDAAYLLGLAHLRGRGVPASGVEAARWFARAAQKEHAPAAYHLGLAHMLGRGVRRDDGAAVELFRKAAEEGLPEAEYMLAVAYTNGRGVQRDDAWAARWYGRAAQKGVARAQYMMAVSAALGLGLPRDYAEAYLWAKIAAAAGDGEARALAEALADRLSPEAKALAERRARSWRSSAERGPADQPTVRFVQVALAELGYDPGEIDGFAGSRTQAALSAWQRDAGLDADGELSAEVVERLKRDRLDKRGG